MKCFVDFNIYYNKLNILLIKKFILLQFFGCFCMKIVWGFFITKTWFKNWNKCQVNLLEFSIKSSYIEDIKIILKLFEHKSKWQVGFYDQNSKNSLN